METVLRKQMAQRHQTKITIGLLQAEASRLQEAIKMEESKCVEMTENTLCPDCKKRFTSQSAFVRYPNGDVVHLSCYSRKMQSLNIK